MEFLLELGCEEIPAQVLPCAVSDLEKIFQTELAKARLRVCAIQCRVFCTPRRLVIIVSNLPLCQSDIDEEVFGPPVGIAFDKCGKPTKAAYGFARRQGIDVRDLHCLTGTKGEVVGVCRHIKGRPTREILPQVVSNALGKLAFPKTMRWGQSAYRFVRPVHWILCLLDGQVIPVEFAGIRSNCYSCGHRITHPEPFSVSSSKDYLQKLRQRDVLVDQTERLKLILREIRQLALDVGGHIVDDPELEEEVVFLTEFPIPLLGQFDKKFLELPREVLVAAMRNHQRYFSIEKKDRSLINAFVAISNTRVEDNRVVQRGYERVLSARLEDARFFYDTDKKVFLHERVPKLQDMIFQTNLGTYYEKAIRVAKLAVIVAESVGLGTLNLPGHVLDALSIDIDKVDDPKLRFSWLITRAALLAKTDLLSEMVGEFPELQGEMGGIYADLAGEHRFISQSIREHYRPRFARDSIPQTDIGAILSIADRLDTLAGCFGVGLRPTGDADPYALRRQCGGVVAIVLGRNYRMSLQRLLYAAVQGVSPKVKKKMQRMTREGNHFAENLVEELTAFFKTRLYQRLINSAPQNIVNAVLAAGMDDMTEVQLRVNVLNEFSRESVYENLAIAFKRVANIIKNFNGAEINPDLFVIPEEKQLYDVYVHISPKYNEYVADSKFSKALHLLATEIRRPVDHFFEQVLVNDPKDQVREFNRKALLAKIYDLFTRIADFTMVQTH